MTWGNLYMAHRCGFTKKVLDGTLRANGFQTVATLARGRAPFFDLWAVASKSVRSQEQMQERFADGVDDAYLGGQRTGGKAKGDNTPP